jgi:SAM-dependent methyltransferase
MAAARWNVGILPFQVGHRSSPSNQPLPDRLPFAVAVDERTGLVVQCPDGRVSRALSDAYRAGSQMGTPLSDAGVGSAQLADVCAFVDEACPTGGPHGLAVLEIGCGDGALMERLAQRGANVVGVEPGKAAAAAARARGLEVHCEPFRPSRFAEQRFDLIIHHTVLEHIERPLEFLDDQLGLLAADGRIICCVPDCAPALDHGDLSMLVHEHWSYFDAKTLIHLGAIAGARTVTWRNATTEGVIYCSWKRDAAARSSAPAGPPPYLERGRRALRAMTEYAKRTLRGGVSLGIYCAARFVNYYALLADVVPAMRNVRWFDDDPALHGRFYPPIPIAVQSRDALLAHPVDELMIASWTFGEALRDQLAGESALAGTRIRTFSDVLE